MTDTLTTGRYTTPDTTSMVGAVLGNYRIIDLLSRGGMGSVYRAQHELLGRPAAIKLLRPDLTANDELVQRFFNEARAATAIRHPGIVEVYDFGYTEEGHAYLVMEFLDGEPLSRALAARGRFSELEAASIARSIASALKAAHAKGIIHRDLKPDNVFLVPDPDGREARVKVLDFGIAKLANPGTSDGQRRTQTGVLMGTPRYMAPEQAREAGTIDHRADLYSLGCILYELLVGQPPFVAEGAGEIIAMQLFSEVEPPSKHVGVSPEMEQLVMHLLAKEPSERIGSAAAVMDALVAIGARMSAPRDVIDSKNIRVPSGMLSAELQVAPTLLEKPAPKSSRTPFLIAGVVLAVAAGIVAFLLTRPEAPKPVPAAEAKPSPVAPVALPMPTPAATPSPSPIAETKGPEVAPSPSPSPVVVKAPKGTKKSAPTETKTAETKPSPIEMTVGRPAATPSPSPKPTTENGSPIDPGTNLFDDKKKTN